MAMMDATGKCVLVLLCTCFTLVQAINGDITFSSGYLTLEARIGLHFCQNSGTPVYGVNFTCICHYAFSGDRCERYIGDHVLYWSFDTLENLTLMRNDNQNDSDALVSGQVNSAVSTNGPERRWVNLGVHMEVCMTHPESCGAAGGAISLWFGVVACGVLGSVVTTVKNTTAGYHIFCSDGFLFYSVDLPVGRFGVTVSTGTTSWVHAVMNYAGPNEGQGIRVYNDGKLIGSDTTRTSETNLPSDRRIVIGRADFHRLGTTEFESFCASVKVDELLIFNRTLTEPEVILLKQRVL